MVCLLDLPVDCLLHENLIIDVIKLNLTRFRHVSCGLSSVEVEKDLQKLKD